MPREIYYFGLLLSPTAVDSYDHRNDAKCYSDYPVDFFWHGHVTLSNASLNMDNRGA